MCVCNFYFFLSFGKGKKKNSADVCLSIYLSVFHSLDCSTKKQRSPQVSVCGGSLLVLPKPFHRKFCVQYFKVCMPVSYARSMNRVNSGSFICLFVYLSIHSFFHYRHNGYGIRASTMFFMRTRNKHNKMRGVTGQFVSGSSASKTQSLNPT